PGRHSAPRLPPADTVPTDLPQDRDVWFGVNPVRTGATGRGNTADVTRWAALYADLDVKPGAFTTKEEARTAINELSDWIGAFPSFIIDSGNGLQPVWRLDPDDPETDLAVGDNRGAAQVLMRRWGLLVARAAGLSGAGGVDSVFDLTRVLRAPGTVNHKEPHTVTSAEDSGGHEITVADLRSALDEWGVPEIEPESLGEIVSPSVDWRFGSKTCWYVD